MHWKALVKSFQELLGSGNDRHGNDRHGNDNQMDDVVNRSESAKSD